jgi:hypothetical protein
VTPGEGRQLLDGLVEQGPRLGGGDSEATGGLLRSPVAEVRLHQDLPMCRRQTAEDGLDGRATGVTVGGGRSMWGGHEKDSGLRRSLFLVRRCVTISEC